MRTLKTFAIAVAVALAVGFSIPMEELAAGLQPLIVAVSIVSAAVLVRLNRGMPTLDWSSLDPAQVKSLTSKILEVNRVYLTALGILGFTSIVLVLASIVKSEGWTQWPGGGFQLFPALVGFTCALSFSWMGHIAWRDLDIVRLQKTMVDGAAEKRAADESIKKAGERIAEMKSAGVRSPPTPPPGEW